MRLLLAVGLLCVAACDEPIAGEPCQLLKPSGDGGVTPIPVSELVAGRDYVSFGVPGCKSGVCIRDSQYGQHDGGNPDAGRTDPAMGYCSAACGSVGSACSSTDRALKLTCRQLLLDGRSLEESPDGGVGPSSGTWPNFCSE